MHAVVALARDDLRQASRSRWVLAGGSVMAVVATAITVLGSRTGDDLGVQALDATTSSLLQVAVLLPPLFALVLAGGSLAGSREAGMLGMLAAQPIRRSSLATAGFLGLGAASAVALGLGFGFGGLVLAARGGTDVLACVAAIAIAGVATTAVALAVGLALSAWSPSRGQGTGLAAAAWFALALGHDLVLAATVPSVNPSMGVTFGALVSNPFEAGRILGLLMLDGGTESLGTIGSYLTDTLGTTGAALACGASLLAWTAAGLAVARAGLRRRDA